VLRALHPSLATVFRQKTGQLAAALQQKNEERRESARQAIRSLIDRITGGVQPAVLAAVEGGGVSPDPAASRLRL